MESSLGSCKSYSKPCDQGKCGLARTVSSASKRAFTQAMDATHDSPVPHKLAVIDKEEKYIGNTASSSEGTSLVYVCPLQNGNTFTHVSQKTATIQPMPAANTSTVKTAEGAGKLRVGGTIIRTPDAVRKRLGVAVVSASLISKSTCGERFKSRVKRISASTPATTPQLMPMTAGRRSASTVETHFTIEVVPPRRRSANHPTSGSPAVPQVAPVSSVPSSDNVSVTPLPADAPSHAKKVIFTSDDVRTRNKVSAVSASHIEKPVSGDRFKSYAYGLLDDSGRDCIDQVSSKSAQDPEPPVVKVERVECTGSSGVSSPQARVARTRYIDSNIAAKPGGKPRSSKRPVRNARRRVIGTRSARVSEEYSEKTGAKEGQKRNPAGAVNIEVLKLPEQTLPSDRLGASTSESLGIGVKVMPRSSDESNLTGFDETSNCRLHYNQKQSEISDTSQCVKREASPTSNPPKLTISSITSLAQENPMLDSLLSEESPVAELGLASAQNRSGSVDENAESSNDTGEKRSSSDSHIKKFELECRLELMTLEGIREELWKILLRMDIKEARDVLRSILHKRRLCGPTRRLEDEKDHPSRTLHVMRQGFCHAAALESRQHDLAKSTEVGCDVSGDNSGWGCAATLREHAAKDSCTEQSSPGLTRTGLKVRTPGVINSLLSASFASQPSCLETLPPAEPAGYEALLGVDAFSD